MNQKSSLREVPQFVSGVLTADNPAIKQTLKETAVTSERELILR